MGAPCYAFVMAYGEDGWPNGCENDSTGEMKCKDCDNWIGGYCCPANDEIYYYRTEKRLGVGSYTPEMTKEETEKLFEEYRKKYTKTT